MEEDRQHVTVKVVDMPEEMKIGVISLARTALIEHKKEKTMAEFIKKECDRLYGPAWHCIVGQSFGSFVTHEAHRFIYFYIKDTAFLLFKTL
jgi:dynein light chain LC8-type